jgi:hypothetical protein
MREADLERYMTPATNMVGAGIYPARPPQADNAGIDVEAAFMRPASLIDYNGVTS